MLADDLHFCPARDCPVRIPFDQMACRGHWFALPPELRRRVSAVWRRGDAAAILNVRREVEAVLS